MCERECVRVCVCERERVCERGRARERVCVCVCKCVMFLIPLTVQVVQYKQQEQLSALQEHILVVTLPIIIYVTSLIHTNTVRDYVTNSILINRQRMANINMEQR